MRAQRGKGASELIPTIEPLSVAADEEATFPSSLRSRRSNVRWHKDIGDSDSDGPEQDDRPYHLAWCRGKGCEWGRGISLQELNLNANEEVLVTDIQ